MIFNTVSLFQNFHLKIITIQVIYSTVHIQKMFALWYTSTNIVKSHTCTFMHMHTCVHVHTHNWYNKHFNIINTSRAFIPLSLCALSLDVVVVVTGTVTVITLSLLAAVTGVMSLLIVLGIVSNATLTTVEVTVVTVDSPIDTTELLAVVIAVGGGGGNVMGGSGCCIAGGWSGRDGWLYSVGGIGLNELGASMLPTGTVVFTVSTSGPNCYIRRTHTWS